jgi:hypothetical protein
VEGLTHLFHGVNIGPAFQQRLHHIGVLAARRSQQRREPILYNMQALANFTQSSARPLLFAYRVGGVNIGTVLDQQLHAPELSRAGGGNQRRISLL